MFTVPEGPSCGDVREAASRAIERNARQMLEPPLGEYEGLPALRRFAAEVGDWPRQLDDWQWCARFCYQVIERRGTGGGNFRLMYSRFLEEAGQRARRRWPPRPRPRWTSLADAAARRQRARRARPGALVARRARQAAGVLEAEERSVAALARSGAAA